MRTNHLWNYCSREQAVGSGFLGNQVPQIKAPSRSERTYKSEAIVFIAILWLWIGQRCVENVHSKLLNEIKILRATLEGPKDSWEKRILLAFQTVPPYPLQGVYLEQSRKQRTKIIIITKSASRGPKKPRSFTSFHGKARSKILGDFIDLTRPGGGVGSTQFGL